MRCSSVIVDRYKRLGVQAAFSGIIDTFCNARVLCVGDVMLDRFVYGSVERISPEAPIPVFSIKDEQAMLGGAGNVARNIVAMGALTVFVSVIGKDKVGHDIAAMLGKEPRIVPHLITEPGRVSTTKTRYVSGMQQMLRADHEVTLPVSDDSVGRLLDAVAQEIKGIDVVLLSDYGKGLLNKSTLQAIITLARDAGKPVLIDPKSRDFSRYQGATCVSPNMQELINASAQEVHSEADVINAARTLMAQHAIENILVTRGKQGMLLVTQNEAFVIPARSQEVYDVSGAGDTAIATLALGVACGVNFQDAATLANTAAGVVVGKPGTAVITAPDLKLALFLQEATHGMHKIMSYDTAAAHVRQWKRDKKIVGLTNGCFDLMHSGHLSLLFETKSHCEKLIVAVNSDASVKRLKGESRPVNNQMERAMLLASLSAVDAVVIFEEDTPMNLLELLKPDVLAKGADYQKHQVVGYELVESYGGKIVLVPLREGYSTTNMIKRIA